MRLASNQNECALTSMCCTPSQPVFAVTSWTGRLRPEEHPDNSAIERTGIHLRITFSRVAPRQRTGSCETWLERDAAGGEWLTLVRSGHYPPTVPLVQIEDSRPAKRRNSVT